MLSKIILSNVLFYQLEKNRLNMALNFGIYCKLQESTGKKGL